MRKRAKATLRARHQTKFARCRPVPPNSANQRHCAMQFTTRGVKTLSSGSADYFRQGCCATASSWIVSSSHVLPRSVQTLGASIEAYNQTYRHFLPLLPLGAATLDLGQNGIVSAQRDNRVRGPHPSRRRNSLDLVTNKQTSQRQKETAVY
jgi:hypothetical protein